MAKSGSGKGSKRTGKEAGLAEKPHWDSSYKIPKCPAPDSSISSWPRTPRKADKHKRPKKKAAKKGSTPNKGSDPKVKTRGGLPVSQPSPQSDLPLDHWARHRPGDQVISANAECVEWAWCLVLFRGSRHFQLIMFETELETRRQAGQQLRLWCAELIDHER